MLGRVSSPLRLVMGTDGDQAMRDLAKQITPLTSKALRHLSTFNEGLFKRVEAVYK